MFPTGNQVFELQIGPKYGLKLLPFLQRMSNFQKYLSFALCYQKTAYLPANQIEESLSFISVINCSMKEGSAFLLFKPKVGVNIKCVSNSIQTEKVW